MRQRFVAADVSDPQRPAREVHQAARPQTILRSRNTKGNSTFSSAGRCARTPLLATLVPWQRLILRSSGEGIQALAKNVQHGNGEPEGTKILTRIPARLDRLQWSRFHLLIVLGLGITWILDGIEVTIVGAIAPVLRDRETLGLSAEQIGSAASAYVASAVLGALVFGWLTDRFGRRLVFYVTPVVYLAGVVLTATSWSFLSFALFRGITGFGIGGEYAAINSAIDELIPAKYRGRVDIIVNGSFWLGAAAGSGASLLFLDPHLLPLNLGWRLGFAIGGILGLGILLLRRYVPESPRWLVTHGYEGQAEETHGLVGS